MNNTKLYLLVFGLIVCAVLVGMFLYTYETQNSLPPPIEPYQKAEQAPAADPRGGGSNDFGPAPEDIPAVPAPDR
ncbi:MAG: hypothetical protein DI551_03095 [Micavibrio aeruginosavorus]|uniref:Uncharacterized protein n=1 Tax=Micavibrio aeruginosavorus TaxID=349221 RepID=A0A2W5Q8D8_9BACT|nr:MAG: hypothetical protein DI551_03095 [Micavibrio aeruginosavorus]